MAISPSDCIPGAGGDGIAALVILDMVDDRLDGPAGQAGIDDALGQDGGAFVAPAELCLLYTSDAADDYSV